MAQVLSVAVRAVALVGLLAVTFGPWYSYVLLRVVYSQRWADTEAPVVLGCYTAYLLLLAVNGESRAGFGVCGYNASNCCCYVTMYTVFLLAAVYIAQLVIASAVYSQLLACCRTLLHPCIIVL